MERELRIIKDGGREQCRLRGSMIALFATLDQMGTYTNPAFLCRFVEFYCFKFRLLFLFSLSNIPWL